MWHVPEDQCASYVFAGNRAKKHDLVVQKKEDEAGNRTLKQQKPQNQWWL